MLPASNDTLRDFNEARAAYERGEGDLYSLLEKASRLAEMAAGGSSDAAWQLVDEYEGLDIPDYHILVYMRGSMGRVEVMRGTEVEVVYEGSFGGVEGAFEGAKTQYRSRLRERNLKKYKEQDR